MHIKMAALRMLCALFVFWLFLMSESMSTTVEMSVPLHPITVGGILPIQCQINDMEDGNTVRIFRKINGQTEEVTSELLYYPSSLGQRVFVTKRTMPGRTLVYFMTIIDTSVHDEGKYMCKVYTLLDEDYVKVAEDSINVDIYFLPDSIYPMCESTPAVIDNMNEDVQLKLKCISAKGAPAVALRWINNSVKEIYSQRIIQDDTVSAEIFQSTSRSLDGTIFICEMTSPGFSNFIKTCQIGPITVKKPIATRNTEKPKPIVPVPTQPTKQNTLLSSDCSECRKDKKYTILYLSMATLCAATLCIIFLITTIIMCYKYHSVSSEVTDSHRRNTLSVDGSEPVYVSLQRRPEPAIPERRSIYKEPDRSSVYMSVEDPNNSGNKVLMPKEVFEEFYNSLTLKKGDQNRSVVGV